AVAPSIAATARSSVAPRPRAAADRRGGAPVLRSRARRRSPPGPPVPGTGPWLARARALDGSRTRRDASRRRRGRREPARRRTADRARARPRRSPRGSGCRGRPSRHLATERGTHRPRLEARSGEHAFAADTDTALDLAAAPSRDAKRVLDPSQSRLLIARSGERET